MQQTLMLLRHAKAVPWGYESDDFSRQLAPRGRRHMKRLARWVREHLQAPERVLCSSSARTVETLDALLLVWPDLENKVEYRDSLYHASAGELHHQLSTALEQADHILMVGHNPGFENLALGMIEQQQVQEIQRMATGTLGVFGFIQGLESAQLLHWVTRRDLTED